MCHFFAAPTLKAVVRHVGAVHGHDAVFRVCCGVQGCPRTYCNFHSYKKHMYMKHRDLLEVCTQEQEPAASNVDDQGDSLYFDPRSPLNVSPPALLQNEKRSSALFLMKTKEINKVSQTCLDGLVEDVTLLLQSKVRTLEAEISCALHHKGVEMDSELTSIFHRQEIVTPFQGIETEFFQKKFYRENFGLVVS